MAKTDFKSVAEYLAAQPSATATVLSKLRTIVKRALPGAEEVISYQIPGYRLHGRTMLHIAGYTRHVALYPASAAVLRALGGEAQAHLASKATLRFALSEPLPTKLIQRAAKARSIEVAELVAGKEHKAHKVAAQKPRARATTATAERRAKAAAGARARGTDGRKGAKKRA